MTSYHIIVSIKFCLDVGNDECIILCNFGGRIMSGFEILEGDLQSPFPPPPPPPPPFNGQNKRFTFVR